MTRSFHKKELRTWVMGNNWWSKLQYCKSSERRLMSGLGPTSANGHMKESKALSFAAQLKCELNKKLQGDQRQLQFPTVISRRASHTPLSLVLLGCAGQLASKAEAAASTCQIFSEPFIDLPHTKNSISPFHPDLLLDKLTGTHSILWSLVIVRSVARA